MGCVLCWCKPLLIVGVGHDHLATAVFPRCSHAFSSEQVKSRGWVCLATLLRDLLKVYRSALKDSSRLLLDSSTALLLYVVVSLGKREVGQSWAGMYPAECPFYYATEYVTKPPLACLFRRLSPHRRLSARACSSRCSGA